MIPEVPKNEKASSSPLRGRLRVLVVDDDSVMAANLLELLDLEGYQACSVSSAEKALEEIDKIQPDIILSDIKLPGIDGRELLRVLRGDPATAHIPVVFMTGYTEKSLAAEADAYVNKPFRVAEFLDVLRGFAHPGT